MIRSVRRARKFKGIPNASARIIDVPEDIKQLVDKSKLDALHKRFQAFDSDSSSFIDSTELTPLLQSLGFNPTEEHVQEILSAFDTDHTGNLTFGEFVEVWAYYCQEAQSEADIIRSSFTFLLQNDSESMSFSEFYDIMMSTGNPLAEEDIQRFFSLCDDESDGILRLDEFIKVLYNQPSLDMSLTRMSDTRQDRPEFIRDMFAKSSRVQRRSLASSIRVQSLSRPSTVVSTLDTQLKEHCTIDPGGDHQSRRAIQPRQVDVAGASRVCGPPTFEAIVEDVWEEPGREMSSAEASTGQPCRQAVHDLLLEARQCDHAETEPTCSSESQVGQMQSLHGSVMAMPDLTDMSEPVMAASCEFQAQRTCGAGTGSIPGRSQGHASVQHSGTAASPDRSHPPDITLRRPKALVDLPSLPSQIHRKLEEMSARTLATPIRSYNHGSSSEGAET
eukprot:jgi/Ulvmu1/10507/UM064_0045.1